MIKVIRTLELSEPPSSVWKRIGAFRAIGDWHPAIVSVAMSLVDGRERRALKLADGAILVEDRIDDTSDRHAYEYRIVEGPLPVTNYTSRFSIEPGDKKSLITWRGTFDADGVENTEAEAVIVSIYEDGLNALSHA